MDTLKSKFIGSLIGAAAGDSLGAIAGACYGVQDMPQEWISQLENRNYIESLANKLWQIRKEGGL